MLTLALMSAQSVVPEGHDVPASRVREAARRSRCLAARSCAGASHGLGPADEDGCETLPRLTPDRVRLICYQVVHRGATT